MNGMKLGLWIVGLLCLCQISMAEPAPYQGWQKQLHQGQQVFTPLDPQYAKAVTVKFYPALSLPQGTTVQAWFEQKLQTSQPPSGNWLSAPSLSNERGYVFYGERLFQNSEGEQYVLKALAVSLDQQTVHLGSVMIAQRADVMQAYGDKAEQLLSEIFKQAEPAQPRAAKSEALADEATKNQGLTLDQIEAVTYDYQSEMNYDGYYEDTSKYYLLLKDGSYYEMPDVAPADFNVAASKKMDAARWGQWQKRSGGYYSTNGKNLGHAVPVADGNTVSVLLKNSSYWGTASSSSVGSRSKYLMLNADGTFEKELSSYVIGGSDDHSINASSHADKNGQSSAVYGSATSNLSSGTSSVIMHTSRESKGLSKDKYGTYILKGYTLELRYADGDVTRSVFFFINTKRDDAYFNGVNYN